MQKTNKTHKPKPTIKKSLNKVSTSGKQNVSFGLFSYQVIYADKLPRSATGPTSK